MAYSNSLTFYPLPSYFLLFLILIAQLLLLFLFLLANFFNLFLLHFPVSHFFIVAYFPCLICLLLFFASLWVLSFASLWVLSFH